MSYPKKRRGVRACIAVKRDEVTLYANKATFRALAEWMTWIADSEASEHYECHVMWHLLNKWADKPNVFIRFEKTPAFASKRRARRNHETFELTFAQVEESDLDHLQRRGLLAEASETAAKRGHG